jgi:hypothetical protein
MCVVRDQGMVRVLIVAHHELEACREEVWLLAWASLVALQVEKGLHQ